MTNPQRNSGWTNFHTHSVFCDSPGDPEEYILSALEKNMKALGFSAHGPLPFATSWTIKPENVPAYCARIRQLKEQYKNKLSVYLGMEIDYIPQVVGPRSPHLTALGLDYCLGSVHYVDSDGQKYGTIDGSTEEFTWWLENICQGNIRQGAERYYTLVREMTLRETPDIIAHLDIIKVNNKEERYFSEKESWYRDAVADTLKTIASTRAIVEINVGGIARKRCPALYPSPWIIAQCLSLGIPVTISADAHSPALLTDQFPQAAQILNDIGYKELSVLMPAGWQARPFDRHGVY